MWNDFLYALRTLRKSPGFLFTVLVALGLGIGANSAIFSVINSLFLNPAGLREVNRIAAIRVHIFSAHFESISVSGADFKDVQARRDLFSHAAILSSKSFNFGEGEQTERLRASAVSPDWFAVMGIRPALGRVFRKEEDAPGTDRVVILTDGVWRRLFGADPSIVGRVIQLSRQPYQVIGVMGPGDAMPGEIYVPIALPPERYTPQRRGNQFLFMAARLQPGVTLGQADREVRRMGQQILAQPGSTYTKDDGWGLFAAPLTQVMFGDLRKPLIILMGAVAFVLFIACSNVAGLLLARASGRSKEVAVRAALGASRWQLMRQFLAESLLLAVGGAAAGLFIAWQGLDLVNKAAPADLVSNQPVHMDWKVLLFTAAVALVAGVAFGLAPAWQGSHTDQHEALKEGGRSGTAGRARQRLRQILVSAEVAIALAMLAGTGLLLRSLVNVQKMSAGFSPAGVWSGAITLPDAQYNEKSEKQFFGTLIQRLKQLPGVRHAGLAVPAPFTGDTWSASFSIEGRPNPPNVPGPHGDVAYVAGSYFETLGIPLRRGRFLNEQDRTDSLRVAIVDEKLAAQYWPNEDPIGKRIRSGGDKDPWYTIVGMVAHIRNSTLEEDPRGLYYFPLVQEAVPAALIVVRSSVPMGDVTTQVRQAVHEVDPAMPVFDVRSMSQRVTASLGTRQFSVILLGLFSGLALLLAALGLYGVVSYAVAQRTQEFGIRMALGANRSDVMGMVLRQSLRLAAVGALVGMVSALVVAQLLKSQLFGVPAFDLVSLLAAVGALAFAVLLASGLPAWRSTRVDPIVALRYE
jgi:predicted permease